MGLPSLDVRQKMNSPRPASHFGWELVLLILKTCLFIFLLLVFYVLFDVVREGFSSSLGSMFESEPREGWDYWRSKKIKEILPEWILSGSIAVLILGTVLWTMIRSVKRLMRSLPNSMNTQ